MLETLYFQFTSRIFLLTITGITTNCNGIVYRCTGCDATNPRGALITKIKWNIKFKSIFQRAHMNINVYLVMPSSIFSELVPMPFATFCVASRTDIHSVRCVHAVASMLYFCKIRSTVSANLLTWSSLSTSFNAPISIKINTFDPSILI